MHVVHNVHSVCKCCIKFRFRESVWRFMLKLKSLCGGQKRIFKKVAGSVRILPKSFCLTGGVAAWLCETAKTRKIVHCDEKVLSG